MINVVAGSTIGFFAQLRPEDDAQLNETHFNRRKAVDQSGQSEIAARFRLHDVRM
jgi:hypothetical protein